MKKALTTSHHFHHWEKSILGHGQDHNSQNGRGQYHKSPMIGDRV